ncbi:MAG TPA: tannase/feruloyl esterase family alpha/beta hydrolase [Phenylobacterium sp.]|uniref:tannase/feruloyl esterase family alpha/beta hydrolase n=1 Tax=Phenylobacterium sp. TaxID=1871053 RepID=UPI002B4A31CB|nr:tannase/feruloyl esterase family alpha/beta hydrolase [Phenylobacterium sp.]HKR89488.1 tannase/feruloyl esterase family alpha/beta hydrolase [Phenylobacterium sp.]
MLISALAAASVGVSPAPASFAAACRQLEGYTSAGLVVTEAREIAEGPAPYSEFAPSNNAAGPPPRLPPHCLVRAELDRRTGTGGVAYAIKLELRIPDAWNGRFLFQGGGGMNGVLLPAIGYNIAERTAIPPALARNFAVVSTDSGHEGTPLDPTFARDQEAKINYGYASIGKVTLAAKALLQKVTGRLPEHSYFAGCSNGGREAMMAAQRFPGEFDGVLAGNPAFEMTNALILTSFSSWVYADAAKQLKTDSAHLFTPADTLLIQKAMLRQCDSLDGAADGMIFNHQACRFDVRKLACRKTQKAGCLDPVKVNAIVRAFRGPLDATGAPFVGSWTSDAGNFSPDWLIWQTGAPTPAGVFTDLRDMVRSAAASLAAFPEEKTAQTGGDADALKLYKASRGAASLTDATSTQLTSFAAHGGKMMLVSGWSDPIFSAPDLIAYYERLSADMNAATGTDPASFARLFLIPGMAHCGGGDGLDDFDALDLLVNWVEKQDPPSVLTARGAAFPGVERPICAYPLIARYKGRGPLNASESFTCAAPTAPPLAASGAAP